jgi:hypothetical protein
VRNESYQKQYYSFQGIFSNKPFRSSIRAKGDTTATQYQPTELGYNAQSRADTHGTDERTAVPSVLSAVCTRMVYTAGYIQKHKESLPQHFI